MRKQELIHLHGLLMELHGVVAEDLQVDLDRYEQLAVRPTSIHKSKGDHREAVLTLSDELAASIEERSTDRAVLTAE